MPHPGDGFTVVSAMRHFQPQQDHRRPGESPRAVRSAQMPRGRQRKLSSLVSDSAQNIVALRTVLA
jgi:hypothetical protein